MWSEVLAGCQTPYLPLYLIASSTQSAAAATRYSEMVLFKVCLLGLLTLTEKVMGRSVNTSLEMFHG